MEPCGPTIDRSNPVPWSLSYYLSSVSHRRGTVFDLDVIWGKGKHTIGLRLIGIAHTSRTIRWYLTTVCRAASSPLAKSFRPIDCAGSSSCCSGKSSKSSRPRAIRSLPYPSTDPVLHKRA